MKNKILSSKMIEFMETFDLDSIEFILAKQNLPKTARNDMDPYHAHDFFEINYSYNGRSKFKFDDQEVEYRPYDFIIIPPKSFHGRQLYSKSEDEIIIIWFKMNADIHKKIIVNINDSQHVFYWLCNEIKRQSEQERVFGKELIRNYLKCLLLQVKQHLLYSSKSDSLGIVDFAVQYIRNHIYMPDLNVSSIAALVNLSPEYFSRLFKQKMKVSPSAFISSCKVNEAKKLLSSGEYSMNEIAGTLGYNNQFYFSKQFKQLTGVTPSAYKRGNTED